MRISIGLELNYEGRALAWALDFPGCFAYGTDGPEATIALARELIRYQGWCESHAGPGWLDLGDMDLRIVDTWTVYSIDDHYNEVEVGYMVNAWFRSDWKPLDSIDIERGLALLEWSRADLLRVLEPLTSELLDRTRTDERWSICGIAKHVANAEWWYLDRLDLASGGREVLPKDMFERLEWVRTRLISALPGLAGQDPVIGTDGEFWSPRKLLRRALWHEIDHREHIRKLLMADSYKKTE